MAYWLMKSEPFKYSWDDLVAEGEGTWDGVRNYQARNNLAAMQVGDEAFFKAKEKFAHPVTLLAIKAEPRLAEMQLIRQSRLSVCGVTPAEWQVICEMARG